MLESVIPLVRDRRAIEALTVAARIFEQATVLRWLADHQVELGEWFRRWRAASAQDLLRLAEADIEVGRRPTAEDEVQALKERASTFPDQALWPPREQWLHDRTVEQGRQRVWWLWRLDHHLQWYESAIEARLTMEPVIGFTTREEDLDDLTEVAAFAVEAATTGRIAVGSILGLAEPAGLEGVGVRLTGFSLRFLKVRWPIVLMVVLRRYERSERRPPLTDPPERLAMGHCV